RRIAAVVPPAIRAGALPRSLAVGVTVRIDAERVVNARPERRMPLAQFPGRPLPNRIAADFCLDLRLAHAGVIIPRSVVGPDLLQKEQKVAIESQARLGRTKITTAGATGMVARAQGRLGFGRKNRVDRNTPHQCQYGSRVCA